MTLDEAVKGRRSIRNYLDDLVPQSEILQLLDLARYTPSSMNGQPWHFVIVTEKATKRQISEIKNRFCPPEKQAYAADFIEKAPAVIVVCVDRKRSFEREVENGILAAATIMLGACSRGLGTVYLSAYRSDQPELTQAIRATLGLPDDVDPISILPMGYPGEVPAPKALRPLKEMVHVERF